MLQRARILLVSSILLMPFLLPAAEESETILDSDAFVFKISSRLRSIPVDVCGVRKEELKDQPVSEMREAIQNLPGMGITEAGGPVRTTFPTIRGSLPRHVRVLFDGIPMNFPDEGSANVNLIPFGVVNDLQVWKTGSSSVYGSGLGGVLSVRSIDPPEENGYIGELTSTLGQWDTTLSLATVGFRKGPLGVLLSGQYEDSSGFRKRSGYYADRGYGKLVYDFNKNSRLVVSGGTAQANLEEFEYERFGFWFNPNTVARFGQATVEIGRFTDLEFSAALYGFDHFIRRDRNAINSKARLARNELGSTRIGGKADVSYTTTHALWKHIELINQLQAGMDVEREIIDTEDMTDPIRYSKRGVFVRDTVSSGRFSLTFGCRFDDTPAYGNYLSPEAGVSISLFDKKLVWRANVDRSFSAPPILWRYSTNAFVVANPDIEAEEAVTYSTGFDLDLGKQLLLRVSAFNSSIDNALTSHFLTPPVRTFKNTDEHRRRGYELELVHEWRFLTFSAAGYWGHVEDRMTRSQVQGRLKQSYKATVEYKNPAGLTCNLQGRYQNLNEAHVVEADERHMIWDTKISYTFQMEKVETEIFITGRNIFDTDWKLNEFNRMPGSSVELGLTVRF